MLRAPIERLGANATHVVLELGRIASFGASTLRGWLAPAFWMPRRLSREIYDTGVLSLPIIVLSGITVGLVLGLQLFWVLSVFGAETSLGGVIGLVLVRELGPVLTGLLVTGRAGSAMAAEIAVMNASEQLDGMRTMAMDPVRFVVGPKSLAMIACMPLLNAIFICCAIAGSYLIAVRLLGRRALVAACVAIVVLSPVLRWIALERTQNAYAAIFLLPMRADGLMAGVLCAVAMRSPDTVDFLRARLRGLILFAVLSGGGLAGLSLGKHGATSPLVVGFGYSAMALFFSALLLLALLQPGSVFARTLSAPVLGFIGRTSYFVYLAHLPVWYWLHWLIREKAPTHLTGLAILVTCLATVVTFALAALSWRFLEEPLLGLGRRFQYRPGSSPGKA